MRTLAIAAALLVLSGCCHEIDRKAPAASTSSVYKSCIPAGSCECTSCTISGNTTNTYTVLSYNGYSYINNYPSRVIVPTPEQAAKLYELDSSVAALEGKLENMKSSRVLYIRYLAGPLKCGDVFKESPQGNAVLIYSIPQTCQ